MAVRRVLSEPQMTGTNSSTFKKLFLFCPLVIASVQIRKQLLGLLCICKFLHWSPDKILIAWKLTEKETDAVKLILVVERVLHLLSIFHH
jgi:hypothetical protein